MISDGRPPSLSWIEPGRIAAMARPGSREIASLPGRGVRALLSLTEETGDIGRTARAHGIEWLHLPIVDFDTPTLAQVDAAVDFMAKALKRGEAVAVHCGAGLGRTGTVIACHLVATGITPDRAIAFVRAARPGSIETAEQEDLVERYALHLAGAPRPGD